MTRLDGHSLTISELWRIARREEACAVADPARGRIRAGRAFVEKVAAEPRAVYGINTGFGPLSGARVSPRDLAYENVAALSGTLQAPDVQETMLPPRPRAPS